MPDLTDDRATLRPTVYGPGSLRVGDGSLAFVTPQLKRMLQVWEAKRGTRTAPCRDDFGLRDLSFALPNIAILAVVREGERVRFRVQMMGSQLDTYVAPMTGKFIDEMVPPEFAEKWASLWGGAVETRRVQRSVGRVKFGGRNYYIAESLFGPLATDGELPDGVLVGTYFHLAQSDQAELSEVSRSLLNEI